MTFARSSSALAVMHKFFKVDKILFCEGGKIISVDESSLLSATTQTLDAIFWRNIIDLLKIKKRFHIKSCGSKSSVFTMLKECRSKEINTIVFAVDSDYHDFIVCPDILDHQSFLVRTHGYSWESDVMRLDVFFSIMRHFIGPLDKGTKRAVEQDVRAIQVALHKWTNLDLALISVTQNGIINKETPGRYILGEGDAPQLNEVFLGQCLKGRKFKREEAETARFGAEDSLRFTFGKLTSRLMYHLLVWHAKKMTKLKSLSYDEFMRLAISYSFRPPSKRHLSNLKQFYQNQSHVFSR
jgi:hypothetical protein